MVHGTVKEERASYSDMSSSFIHPMDRDVAVRMFTSSLEMQVDVCTQVHMCIYIYICAESLWLCPTLCNPRDCGPPGSSVHGSLQARILEWVAVSFSREHSQSRDGTCVS